MGLRAAVVPGLQADGSTWLCQICTSIYKRRLEPHWHKHDDTSELAQAALMGLSWPWILAG